MFALKTGYNTGIFWNSWILNTSEKIQRLSSLANLAKAPAMPQEVKIDVKKLGNNSLLYWKAPASGTVKGYYVMMRETTSAVWQRKIFTAATQLQVPYSKDNYFFAVQSVNAEGNESLPVVPAVGR